MPDYVIRETRAFYGPRAERRIVADDFGALVFSSRRDALAWIDQRDGESYHQRHNEYGRPDYVPVRTDRLPAYLAAQL